MATVDLSVLFLFLGTAQTHLDLFKRSSQPEGGWGRGVLKASCHGDYVFPFCERYMDGQGPAPACPPVPTLTGQAGVKIMTMPHKSPKWTCPSIATVNIY